MKTHRHILADASLPHLASLFNPFFSLTLYHNEDELKNNIRSHDILLCRTTQRIDASLLEGARLQCIASASSGTDHIDHAFLQKQEINLFDAKGCNATAVVDYILSSMAYLRLFHGITGRRIGIMGVGYVGRELARRLNAIDFDVRCFDPLRAQRDHTFKSCTLDDLTHCDFISVHANLHLDPPFPSWHLLNAERIQALRPKVILNASRGQIVDETALLEASCNLLYCTDVYTDEPRINPLIIERATLCTPHIAGHSLEAKHNAVRIISEKLHQHYGIPLPKTARQAQPNLPCPLHLPRGTWEETLLHLYNPLHETEQLKKAASPQDIFLPLRQAHQTRHDLTCYTNEGLDRMTQRVMGVGIT